MAKVAPLSYQTPIVEPDTGRPSNFFIRLWQSVFNTSSLRVSADRTIIKYDGAGDPSPATQTTTFTATKQNAAVTVNWTVKDTNGNDLDPAVYLSATSGDVVTMTIAQFDAAWRVNNTQGVRVIATVIDSGDTYKDQATLTKVDDGAAGHDGTDGAPGASGYTWIVYADDINGFVNFTTGAPGKRGFQGISANQPVPTESLNPADYIWGAYKGPALFGLVPMANVVVGPDYIVKTGGTSGSWDASAYSSEGYYNGATLSFTIDSSYRSYMVGLNTDPTTDAGFSSIDYAFYVSADSGNIEIYESGSLIATIAAISNQRLTITYDSKNVNYYVGGTLARTVSVSPGLTFYFDTSLRDSTSRIDGIAFAPVGKAGVDGPTGATGPTGAPGSAGPPGAASSYATSIASTGATDVTPILTLTNGQTVTVIGGTRYQASGGPTTTEGYVQYTLDGTTWINMSGTYYSSAGPTANGDQDSLGWNCYYTNSTGSSIPVRIRVVVNDIGGAGVPGFFNDGYVTETAA